MADSTPDAIHAAFKNAPDIREHWEREAFEAWGAEMMRWGGAGDDEVAAKFMRHRAGPLFGEYVDTEAEARWQAWKARASLNPPPADAKPDAEPILPAGCCKCGCAVTTIPHTLYALCRRCDKSSVGPFHEGDWVVIRDDDSSCNGERGRIESFGDERCVVRLDRGGVVACRMGRIEHVSRCECDEAGPCTLHGGGATSPGPWPPPDLVRDLLSLSMDVEHDPLDVRGRARAYLGSIDVTHTPRRHGMSARHAWLGGDDAQPQPAQDDLRACANVLDDAAESLRKLMNGGGSQVRAVEFWAKRLRSIATQPAQSQGAVEKARDRMADLMRERCDRGGPMTDEELEAYGALLAAEREAGGSA